MTRTHALLDALGWSQSRLADRIGVTQTTIWRLASRGERERGPVRIALDTVAREHGLDHLTAEQFDAAADLPNGVTGSVPAELAPDAALPAVFSEQHGGV